MWLTGTFTALITPFEENSEKIDWPALKKLVEWQVKNSVEGLVPCGTTGESPTLSHAEHAEVISKVIEWSKATDSKTKVIAGTGSNSTREAINLTKEAAKSGADAVLSVNPYYNKPTQEGLYRHFASIADASSIPVVLYNIPGRSAVGMTIDTVKKLASHGNIIGIKEATGDLGFMTQIITECPDFTLLSGDDNLLLPVLSVGGKGVISVISNIFPRQTSEITRLYMAGKLKESSDIFKALFPLCKYMFIETNPIPVKFSASVLGLCKNTLRLPMTSLSQVHEESVRKAITVFQEKTK